MDIHLDEEYRKYSEAERKYNLVRRNYKGLNRFRRELR